MKKKMIFGAIIVLLLVQVQTVFANGQSENSYESEFRQELERNNLRNIESLLQRRSKQMNLNLCMLYTIKSASYDSTKGFNKANCIDVIRLLMRYGADINSQHVWYGSNGARFEEGYPLENAIEQKHSIAVIQFLLDSGANPNYASSYEGYYFYPIRQAYSNRDMPVVNLLLDRGANGAVILPSAGSRGDNEMIRLLISRGVQIRSDQGAEALRWAAVDGHFDTIKLLVENGVNVNARNEDGESALSIAYDKGEMEIYDYLMANGAREFEPRQTAQPATSASSSPSSTTQTNVQPSAPAQSTPAPAPSTPTLQTGTYAWANSGVNMTMSLNTIGTVSAFLNNSPIGIWHGTYQINGNQLVITVTTPTSDYAGLRGQTYAYTITSSTSFSGSGETWVRR
jgi:ankyrin repeat protein